MINIKNVKLFCCEDISLIENYDKAIADKTQTWHSHHRLETEKNLSVKELRKAGLYYHRPASELIFLTPFEHYNLHYKDKPLSEEIKKKISEANKGEKNPMFGKHLSEEIKKKISETKKGKHHSEETKQKMSESRKGEKNPMYGKNAEDYMTEEAIKERRRKMSESHKGEKCYLYGKHLSEETKRKMSEAKKLYWKQRKEANKSN